MREYREKGRKFCGKNVTILQVKDDKNLRKTYGKGIFNYDIIKFLMLNSQSKEFHKIFVELFSAAMVFAIYIFAKVFL